jgi:hypothetical protein
MRHTLWLLCLGIFSAVPSCWSQVPVQPTPTKRDPAALAILTQAITAMRGQGSASQITTLQTDGSISPAINSGYPGGAFTWTMELTSTGYEFRNQLTQTDGTVSLFVSGFGSPKISLNGSVASISRHMALGSAPAHVGFLVLARALGNSTYTVAAAAPSPIGSVSTVHVHLSNDADGVIQSLTSQEWYFDPTSGLPLRVEYCVPDSLNALHCLPGTRDFANYQATGGFLLPLQITNSLNGNPVSITTITSVQFNVAVTASEFDLPLGAN